MRAFIAILTLPGLTPPLAAQATDAAREAEVLAVVEAFHSALATGDSSDDALSHLHPEVLIYEGGHAESLAEYRGGHFPADIAFASATRRQLTEESVSVWGDEALYTSESRTTWQYRDREIDSRGRGIVLSPAVGAVLMSLSTVIVALNAQCLRRADLGET